jgi:glycerol kinase
MATAIVNIISIDQGTSSTRVIAFDKQTETIGKAQEETKITCSRPGYFRESSRPLY